MISNSILLAPSPQMPVLLVFKSVMSAQRSDVEQLLKKAQLVLNSDLQIICISETTHPEVVRSFGITSLPAFVLLQRGQELWRYTGPIDSPELFHEIEQNFAENPSSLNLPPTP